jgi:phosphoribosylformylglycinamidine cyclo-ligase
MSEAYKQAGVDLSAGYAAVKGIKKHAARTFRPEVLSTVGGFGGLFALPLDKYKDPVLVSGTDGVGTKLKLAFALNKHDTVGIDLVAMCVNDVVALGAEPLFFLDYFACGRVDPHQVEAVVKGIADGCEDAGCSLIGGETAEMPGFYPEGEYDLAGFCVGIVDRNQIITGEKITPGDVLIGLPSSGVHSNGFSLVRKILAEHGLDVTEIGPRLLKPTRIYVKPILNLLQQFELKGIAHITGGGFIENIPRILPEGCSAEVELGSWPILPIFTEFQSYAQIPDTEMFNVFNMGIGMVIAVDPEDAERVIDSLHSEGEQAYRIGRVTAGDGQVVFREGV